MEHIFIGNTLETGVVIAYEAGLLIKANEKNEKKKVVENDSAHGYKIL